MSREPLPTVMPVFPLPGVVLFPGAVLPLHVFEPRYRQMVEDVMKTGGWFAVALLDPAGAGLDPPPFHPVAGAGQITTCRRLPDGRYDIEVTGRARVRLTEVASDRPYRRVETTALPEDLDWLGGREGTEAVTRILAAGQKMGWIPREALPDRLPADPEDRAALLNQVASVVMADGRERQALLVATDYRERSALLLRQIRLAVRLAEALARGHAPGDVRRN